MYISKCDRGNFIDIQLTLYHHKKLIINNRTVMKVGSFLITLFSVFAWVVSLRLLILIINNFNIAQY